MNGTTDDDVKAELILHEQGHETPYLRIQPSGSLKEFCSVSIDLSLLYADIKTARDERDEALRTLESLREAVWPGKPHWAPTPEKPQQDFSEAVAESLRDSSLLSLPAEFIEHIGTLGRVQWGAVGPKSDEDHIKDFAQTLSLTRAAHLALDEKTSLNGVYVEGVETVVCHTGNSPNSAATARLFVGLWNYIYGLTNLPENEGTVYDPPAIDEAAQ